MSAATARCPVCDARPEQRDGAVVCLRCNARRLRPDVDDGGGTQVRVVRVDGGIEVRVFVPDDGSEDDRR